MMDIKEVLLLWFINFLIKSPLHLQLNQLKVVMLIMKLNKKSNWLKNYKSELLKNVKKEEFILHLKTIFGGADLTDMQLISKFNKGLDFYYVLLIFLVNMLGLFL